MSYSILQRNLEKLIRDKNYHITELERKIGAKKNSVYNILSGASKKPSAELLQSIADSFGITVKDLYSTETYDPYFLTEADMLLMQNISSEIKKELLRSSVKATWVDFANLLKESFDYSIISPEKQLDEKFIKWLIQKKFSKSFIDC